MKIVVYQIFLRITRFVILVIRPDYQKFCSRSTPAIYIYIHNCCYSIDNFTMSTMYTVHMFLLISIRLLNLVDV